MRRSPLMRDQSDSDSGVNMVELTAYILNNMVRF
jgi:hypothetical protein